MNQQESSTRLWSRPFVALTVSSLLLFLNLQMLLSSFPAYVKDEFQANDIQLSLVTTVFALTAIAARFATNALMRRVSRKSLLYIGFALAASMTILYSLAGQFGLLLALRVGYGIGFGMASTIIPTLVSRIIPSRRMGEGIGYFGLSTSLAMSFGPMIGLNVMNGAGFPTLTVVGTITMLAAFPLLLLSRAIPPEEVKEIDSTASEAAVQVKVKTKFNRKLLLPGLLNVLLAITYGGVLSFLALYGESVHLAQVGLFFLFNAATIIIVRPISGKLFDRRGPAAVLVPAALFVVASMTVLSYANSMPLLIVSALLYGLGFGAIQPSLQAWMLRSSPPEQYGMANSMFYNSTDFGVATGALMLGAIASLSDYSRMYLCSAGIMTLFLVLLVAEKAWSSRKSSLQEERASKVRQRPERKKSNSFNYR